MSTPCICYTPSYTNILTEHTHYNVHERKPYYGHDGRTLNHPTHVFMLHSIAAADVAAAAVGELLLLRVHAFPIKKPPSRSY